ncbi:amidohydrolase family protein [Streptantibioticus rubrisoli]|uniref:Amidohydrolase family protein n=1 Tax=Streptantibioticus rubrisoli TaxID=1387313 RepID=A0ABT1PQI2_9ACTN|nr:amidohydrolase family protein [Streptantibioticus rubrisoli]MCQ4046485.1 amidohydrolase family protein [Streptantibioticus rubrisoli]
MRVDAHHHLWDLSVREQPWMDGPWADPIRRTYRLDHLAPELDAHDIQATVVVQACSSAQETEELLTLAGESNQIAAVVGWADLTDPQLGDRLARLSTAPGGHRLAGIRHQVQDEPDPRWLRRPDVRHGLARIAEAGLVYDLLVTPRELPAAISTVRELPRLVFVLDHAAKPPVADGEWQPWADLISELATAPNVVCKLSGLVTEADWRNWTPEQVLPYARHVLDAFGPQRVMYGSDWPVCTLAASYDQVTALAERCAAGLDHAERAMVFGGTAARVYRLNQQRSVRS